MQPVPNLCKDGTEDIANDGSNDDDRNRGREIEGIDDDRHTDHMRPHTEVHERLRPAESNKNRPDEVHATEELTECESCLSRIEVIHKMMLSE